MAILRRRRSREGGSDDTSATPAPEAPAASSEGTPDGPPASTPGDPRPRGRRGVTGSFPVQMLRAAHPRQALVTAAGMAGAAALVGRAPREIALVGATVLVGQAVLGWHNDLVDRERDRRHDLPGKPLAQGDLEPGTVWFALLCGLMLVVPLSVTNGVTAGSAYLISLVLGLLANVVLRRTWLSWLPWAAVYALYPAVLSYGGWGGDYMGDPPEISITVLAALLGVGMHFLRALPGLVPDHEDGWRSLPLRIALRTGATRLLVLSIAWTALVVAALLVTGSMVGLAQ